MVRSAGRGLLAVLLVVAAAGCASLGRHTDLTGADLESALEALDGESDDSVGLLYRMRAAGTGRLGLTVLRTAAGEGRLSVTDTFGSLVAVVAWSGPGLPVLYDLREDCALEGRAFAGLDAVPLDRAVRLMAGHLPSRPGDRFLVEDGRLVVKDGSWTASVILGREPWRVLHVATGDLSIRLFEHERGVPGRITIAAPDESVELELRRIEHGGVRRLPEVPDLPWCRAR